LYLAQKRNGRQWTYRLRETIRDGERFEYRELADLGPDPARHIEYPGGNSFYFDQDLVGSLTRQGVADVDRKLECVLLPFLDPEIRRIVEQMTRLGARPKRHLTREAMARRQERLHLFDRRRFFFLRFGRVDSNQVVMRPHKFLNTLIDMCRDEMEYCFRDMERRLRLREKKAYVYQALDLGRWFPGEIPRLFPQGLDPQRLDEVFLSEICRLNQDPDFLSQPRDRLSDHLVRYLVMWFDYEFGQKPPQATVFEEFVRSRSSYRPPPPPNPGLRLAGALDTFDLTEEAYRSMTRTQITRIYRRRALREHPDQGGDAEAFVKLNQAYQRLIDGKGSDRWPGSG
jgi:hypothetical protein